MKMSLGKFSFFVVAGYIALQVANPVVISAMVDNCIIQAAFGPTGIAMETGGVDSETAHDYLMERCGFLISSRDVIQATSPYNLWEWWKENAPDEPNPEERLPEIWNNSLEQQ